MRAVVEEKLGANSDTFRTHIDRCLGCRACEPVCPAGVEYGQLLEASRATLFPVAPSSFTNSALRFVLRHVWLHPARLRFTFAFARLLRNSGLAKLIWKSGLARLVSERMQFGLGLLISSEPQLNLDDQASSELGTQANQALLFTGCVTEGLFQRVNEATKRVLQVNEVDAQTPTSQVCCGALHAHAGDLEGARVLARQNIAAFGKGDEPIITNAGGCGAMLVSYSHLLANDPEYAQSSHLFAERVRDVSQQLEGKAIKLGASLDGPVTYDASCHLINGQHATEAPLKLLRAIPNLNFVPLEGAERCCGGAGIYNLLERRLSTGVLAEKLDHIRETGAAVLATGNPGCQMQIGAGALEADMKLKICHPVEMLDESYRRAGFYKEGSIHPEKS